MKIAKPLSIGLYVNDPKANILKFVRCFREWGMNFVSIPRSKLSGLRPGDCDVLMLHGGWYGIDRQPGQNQSDVKATPENFRMAAAVRNFTKAGGGVVGVCCGAYNVVWLGLIEAEMSRSHGVGPHSLEVVDEKHPIVKSVLVKAKSNADRRWMPVPCVRVSGPFLFPKNPKHLLLSYDWEHRLGAVLAAPYGRGRAVAISPHPEMTENERGLEVLNEPLMPVSNLLRASLEWSAGRTVSP